MSLDKSYIGDSMLSLYKLEIFTAVVDTGSFSKAAERLLLTQSAISQHINDLEISLGTRLFDRGPRGVTLTDTGVTLHEYTQQILHLIAEAQNAVTDVSKLKNGQITVGATPGVNVYLLPQWINNFRKQFAHLTISAQTNTTKQLIALLANRQLDIAVIEGEIDTYQQDHLGSIILEEIQLFVIVGKDHPFWDRDTIHTEELSQQAFIARPPASQTRIWTDSLLHTLNIQPNIIAEFDNQEAMKQAISNGMGITLLPDYAVQNEVTMGTLRALKINNLELVRHIKLIWDNRHIFSPVTIAFLKDLSISYPQINSII
jgi:DNA-binding transcriptional LysR family regulator